MADALAKLPTTLALGTKESIAIPVCGQWVVTSPIDEGVEEVQIVFVYKVDEEDLSQPSSITWNTEGCQVS